MLNVFGTQPNWEEYYPDPDAGVPDSQVYTGSIEPYFSIDSKLGGETFFLVNKEGKEVPTPAREWITS